MTCFEALPLAALATNAAGERFFCVHGGISPHVSSLDDIADIDRFGEIPSDGAMCDLLWSDPLYLQSGGETTEWLEMRWEQNRARKISYTFGWGVLESFLENNNLCAIIRAHEVKQEGMEALWFGFTPETRKCDCFLVCFVS
jgi:serine/threonine-protein phosphatase 2B catalytic subunit